MADSTIAGEFSGTNTSPTLGFPVTVQNSYASNLESSALQQMAYDSDFAEDINMKMRIPQKLTVGDNSNATSDGYSASQKLNGNAAYDMEVPDRIVVSVGENGVRYGGSHDELIIRSELYNEDFPQAAPTDNILSLATPPRKLTLEERNLDTLDIHESQQNTSVAESEKSHKAKESLSGVLMKRIVPEVHNESMEELDVSLLRRQVFKLHRRITTIEKQQEEKSKRDLYVYAVTIAFWFINGWFLYSSRRPY